MSQEAAVPPDVYQSLRRMWMQDIADAYRSGALRNASISEGGNLIVKGGLFAVLYPEARGGGAAVAVGDLYAGGSPVGTGLLVQAPDGTDMIVARYDEFFGNTRVDIYDSGGRIIFGNDASSEQGLARPYIGGPFAAHRFPDFRYSVTSPSFETVASYWVTKQHPKIRVTVRASMDTSGETGELRVMENGVQLGATTAEAFAISTRDFGPASFAGDHMERRLVEVQGRRVSGAGTLRIEPMGWEAVQS